MYEKFVEIAMLYDFYGNLLSSKQQRVIELYYLEDLSLSEIGENLQISRQAVHDMLKRSEKGLYEYETKLGLIAKFEGNKKRAEQILELANKIHVEGLDSGIYHETLELIISLAKGILENNQEDK
ncbi:MAG: YlxM family DNA-binding protein [Tissierellales bacterium]|jgi:predicted DNA-binding protein YlxM (UPF0122 family)|nr:YlxM family DNA-binding protein [Tissierellales bacterium]